MCRRVALEGSITDAPRNRLGDTPRGDAMQNSGLKRNRLYPISLPDVSADAPTFDGTEVPVAYLFRYWDRRFALKAFLVDFPEVSPAQALAALRKRVDADFPADSEDGRMGGMPVFRGTRVPIKFMFDSLTIGENVEGFLSDYTSVEREDALRILEIASELVEVATYENSSG